ncbi:MAG: hypothetical protein AAGA80_28860 [Cyanobacteria bacterium P01_F01_bin.143]
MHKVLSIVVITLGFATPSLVNAQETFDIDTSISQEDFDILKNLACTGDASDPKLQASLVEMESVLNQVFDSYGLEITDEQLEALGAMATDAKQQLEAEESVQAFCSN